MATGDFSNRFGKRPSSGKPLGRPGAAEHGLAGYAHMRLATSTFLFTGGITDTTLNIQGEPVNRVVNAQAIGAVGTLPRPLTTILVPALRTANSTAATQRRNQIPYPMALIARIEAAAAAPLGTHSITIRICGENQFGEPIQEDLTVTALASGVPPANANTLGVKPFKKIYSVNVIGENNSNAADTVTVFFSPASNGVFGLPGRVRDASDLVSMHASFNATGGIAGAARADFLVGAPSAIVVDIANQTVSIPAQAWADAGFDTSVTIQVRTTLGMDQGYQRPSGQKFIKAF